MTTTVKFKRFLLILVLFSFTLGLVAGVLVLTSKAATDPRVYLPSILGGSGSATPPLPPPSSGPLDNDGTVTNTDGVTVGAVSGTLSITVQVTITQVSAPPEALFPGATPRGNYYQIQTGADTFAPLDKPFILGLPVPSGVLSNNLAIAVLVPAGQILDYESTAASWSPKLGVYDAARNLLFVTMGGLTSDGFTFVLIEHTDLKPLQTNGAGNTAGPDLKSPANVAFLVQCIGFSSPAKCSAADVQYVIDRLVIDHDQLVNDLDFDGPALPSFIGGLDPVSGMPTVNSYNAFYDIFIRPDSVDDCPGASGVYLPDSPELVICKDPNVPLGGDVTDRTIRHEFFHALEYAYLPVFKSLGADWIVEGTAAASERSYTDTLRSPDFNLHPVDVSIIMSGTYAYQAQDFWVFLGQKGGLGLDYLQPMFKKGADDEDAVDTYGNGDHLEAYWDWAKNQAMEKTFDFEGALTNPCSLQANVVDNQLDIPFEWQQSLKYDIGSVDPLNTAVVEILWDRSYDLADVIVAPTNGIGDTQAVDALRYKIYRDGEGGCEAVPDGRRILDANDGEISPNLDYYALISNINPLQDHPYTVYFEVSPLPPN